MQKNKLKNLLSILMVIVMVSSAFVPVDFGFVSMEAKAAESGKIVDAKSVHVSEEDVLSSTYHDEMTEDEFRKLKKSQSRGVSTFALTETVSDTGLLKSSLSGLALEIYEALESVTLSKTNNGVEILYKDRSVSQSVAYNIVSKVYSEAMYAYAYDNLEKLYWNLSNGIGIATSGSSSAGYYFRVYFEVSPYHTEALESQAKAKITSAVNSLSGYTSLYEKYYYANQWVIDNCTYDYANLDAPAASEAGYYAHTAMGLLIKGTGVCETYAKTFKIICQRLGIPCVVVISEGHAFNYVKIDGNWYLIDPTWNDSNSNRYFLISNSPYIDVSHTPSGLLAYPTTAVSNYVSDSHHWDTGTVTKKATCETAGTTVLHCTDAGCGQTKTVAVAPSGHKYDEVSTTATCQDAGITTLQCRNCDNLIQRNSEALGHSLTDVNLKYNADYTACQVYFVCDRCQVYEEYSGDGVVESRTVYSEPTCTMKGSYYLTVSYVYKVGTATRTVTVKETVFPSALGHQFSNKETIAPTCTSKGYDKGTCTRCGESAIDNEKPALGHDYQVTSTTAATCTTDGKTAYKCSRCSETKSEVLPKTGHSYTKITVAPTCTAEGYDRYTCSKCKDTYTNNQKAALGHDYVETERVLPLDGKAGYVKSVCTRCADEKEEILSPKSQTIKVTESGSTTVITSVKLNVGKTIQLAVSGAKTDLVYSSKDTTIATVSSTGLIKGKKPGIVKITVKAKAAGEYAASKTLTIEVDVRPGVTASLKASNVSSGVKLTWEKVSGATGYCIYCNDVKIGKVSSTSVTYTDKTTRTNGTKLKYKIVAYAANGKSTSGKTVTTYRVIGPTISSLTNSSAGALTVKYTRVSGYSKVTGYQIQYSSSSSFSSYKTKTITNNGTFSATLKSLTKGKTYYVRVRSYKTVSSTKYYSCWSAKKSLKITR